CSTVDYRLFILFFFSSRRRHTRSTRDWSSDVCSSDLQRRLRPHRGRQQHGAENRQTLRRGSHRSPPSHAKSVSAAGETRRCMRRDRKSTRLNSSHEWISYAVFCLKKKKITTKTRDTLD